MGNYFGSFKERKRVIYFNVPWSNQTWRYSLQCIIGEFQIGVTILKFSRERERERERESFTLVCPKVIKHGNSVGNQRIVGLFYYIYANKFCLSSTSNALYPLRLLLTL